jgi:hypothetical protein
LTYLAAERRVSAATQTQALSALLFLFWHGLERPLGALSPFPRARAPVQLPVVLTREVELIRFRGHLILQRERSPRNRISSRLLVSCVVNVGFAEVTVSSVRNTRGLIQVTVVALCALLFGGAVVLGGAIAPPAVAQDTSSHAPCGASSAAQLRTTLYFGLARPTGSVSELEWQIFLHDEVTSRFPEGLTVWEATGQWRRPDGQIERERVKVLLLIHPDSPVAHSAVQSLIAQYRQKFDQESVLWETAHVCVAS